MFQATTTGLPPAAASGMVEASRGEEEQHGDGVSAW